MPPSTAEARQQPLTHRPRDLAKLRPASLKANANAVNTVAEDTGASHGLSSGSSGRNPQPSHDMASPSNPADAPDLQPFADQLIAIAEQLRTGDFSAAPGEWPGTGKTAPPAQANVAPALETLDPEQRRKAFAEMARSTYAKRRKRVAIFGDPELFGEPGWDILLDLYIAQIEEKSVSVSSACIGSASPPTTGLRWLGVLADQGLVEREHDPQDQRRVLVRLTDKALGAMDDYFASSASLNADRRAART